MERNNSPDSFFLKTHLTVQMAAEVSGYNAQYLRRLLRAGKLKGDKIGQIWLIRKESFEAFLLLGEGANDRRFGPKRVISLLELLLGQPSNRNNH
jgi:excisionase family DNA binding protein